MTNFAQDFLENRSLAGRVIYAFAHEDIGEFYLLQGPKIDTYLLSMRNNGQVSLRKFTGIQWEYRDFLTEDEIQLTNNCGYEL